LNGRKEKITQELQDRGKELKTLQEELGFLDAGNPAYKKKQEDLERKAVELKVWQEWQTATFLRESGLQTAGLYRKIAGAAAKVAKDSGFDVVLYKEPEPEFNVSKPEEIKQIIRGRKVLWTADDLDLTDQVTQLMNNEYA